MNNFIVGLTNTSPTSNAALTFGYTLCGQWPGVALDGQTMGVACAPDLSAFRYVIIRTGAAKYLTFCEVQVFSTGKLDTAAVV